MKNIFCLFLLSCSMLSYARTSTDSTMSGPQYAYFAFGMQHAEEHIHTQFARITERRDGFSDPPEADFIREADFYKTFFAQHAFFLQELVWNWEYSQHSRWVNKCLQQIRDHREKEAEKACAKYLSQKTLSAKNLDDFRFITEFYLAQADYVSAEKLSQQIVNAQLASAADYALLAFSKAARPGSATFTHIIQQGLEAPSCRDTLSIVNLHLHQAQLHRWRSEPEEAKRELISAQYLADHWSGKTSAANRLLLAKINLELGELYLSSSQFEDALPLSKEVVEYWAKEKDLPAFYYLRALYFQASLYLKGGDHRSADTLFHQWEAAAEAVSVSAPVQTDYWQLKVWDDYAEVCRWFDRNDEYEAVLRKSKALRAKLLYMKDPFMRLDFARNCAALGQKIMDVNLKVYVAEEQWLEAKNTLVPYEKTQVVLYGDLLAEMLYKLATVKLTVKQLPESTALMEELLALRERQFALCPQAYKQELMMTLAHMASLNFMNKEKDIATERIKRAKEYANELHDAQLLQQIDMFMEDLMKK